MRNNIIVALIFLVLGYFVGNFSAKLTSSYDSIYAEVTQEQRDDLAKFIANRQNFKNDREALDSIFSRFHMPGPVSQNGGWTRYEGFHVMFAQNGNVIKVCLQPSDVIAQCSLIIE